MRAEWVGGRAGEARSLGGRAYCAGSFWLGEVGTALAVIQGRCGSFGQRKR